ncbi:CoA-disulfide reductase [Anaerocolumna chitinilytica]|uniref:Pyridine nucleotide-disulfide oxidoreductase n=1 Tax=Anaerocolumna chitinilytica TaxID=1727145 RepID=A0A7I8DN79_9FIRM|nr:CoA-disulfide reductase [Anaerocolumna chitinilytica]BCJ98495.1 pyridine nucleotide-disulfide oxidoreductase [Anaerocolumna chitinilytica]
MAKKVLIVGGVAGGASAAARLRRLDENIEIIMFERDGYISYANCGLPYYIGDAIKEREKLLVQTPQAMKDRFQIDVRIHSEVIAVDTAKRCVTVQSKERGIYEESFDDLILSPGAKALRPGIPGIDSSHIYTLRNVPDTDKIKRVVEEKKPSSAIVIGGGFVGVEMAENLKEKGTRTAIVEAAPHILAPFDEDMVISAERELVQNGIRLFLNDGITGFSDTEHCVKVQLKSGRVLEAELVILAMGVRPDTEFLRNSGIELGERGHIKVNERLQTNIEGIYAVGDAIEGVDYVTGSKTAVALAGPANKQGRIAADNIAGIPSVFEGFLGTSIIKVFDLTVARTGANERTLKAAGINYKSVHLYPMSHASYYPGAFNISLKLLFDMEGKILGAQATGYEGVDKRIDVISTVMTLKGTTEDLTKLDLSYAPPFSSAKDPVNMAGYAAENVRKGLSHVTTWEKVYDETEEYQFLDVRNAEEYDLGHMDGSVNIPVNELRGRLDELDRNKKIILYCQVGLRGYIADRILTQKGYEVQNVSGGYLSAKDFLYQIEREESNESNEREEIRAAEISDTPIASNMALEQKNDRSKAVGSDKETVDIKIDKTLDCTGICCPGPLLRVKEAVDQLKVGEVLKANASDPGFYEDVNAWCKNTGNQLLSREREKGGITALIKKGAAKLEEEASVSNKNNKTMVVFSGDLDKAIASFIIANGAASMGRKVTMFFTFWGLNILRKPEKVKLKKGFMDGMFGKMMPRGSRKLKLSNMNMMGMGAKMIRKVMNDKNVESLESLIRTAMGNGVEIVACQMSMDVMGLRQEELMDGIKIGGVGYYLGEAEESNVNLFI